MRTARALLKSMSVKQGLKFDSPKSVKDILPFIQYHRLPTDELLLPVESYSRWSSILLSRP
jgi:phosphatidylserine decarboxylase